MGGWFDRERLPEHVGHAKGQPFRRRLIPSAKRDGPAFSWSGFIGMNQPLDFQCSALALPPPPVAYWLFELEGSP